MKNNIDMICDDCCTKIAIIKTKNNRIKKLHREKIGKHEYMYLCFNCNEKYKRIVK